ncbi:hypothetical protein NQD34_002247, partial [Periophthalmus magnuspinnatus]
VSELRLVLLGNNWSLKASVGNLLLRTTEFTEHDKCVKGKGTIQDKELTVICSSDQQFNDISQQDLQQFIQDIKDLSSSGPHVFLLVLQPEDFTEEQKHRLESVLESFSEQAFQHSLVLMFRSRAKTPGSMEKYMRQTHIRDMISRCRYRYLWMDHTDLYKNDLKEFKHKVLFSRIFDMLKEKHADDLSSKKPSLNLLRLVLLGNNWSLKASVGNLLLRKTEFTEHDKCVKGKGTIQGKELTVICSSDQQFNNISQQDLKQFIQDIKDLSSSGPHVFLLVLQPEDFTEEQKRSLESVLESFSEQAFHHSLVLMFRPETETPGSMEKYMRQTHIRDMISRCRYRYLWMDHTDLHPNDLKEFKHKELFSRIGDMLKENNADDLSSKKPSLNLVLFGMRGAGKTSAAMSILGRSELCEASPGKCAKHEGEVCGWRVSLVELPPLSGKPMETVKQLCLNCISLCAPEGVHAFILVLPGPLTDEDKEEVEILQKTLSAQVRDFTVGLISVSSNAAAVAATVDSRNTGVNLEELGQICGGGALCLNIRDPQKVTELMDTVDKLTQGGTRAYSKDLFLEALIEEAPKSPEMNLSLKSLRIALIGKRSRAIANTILGVKHFQPKAILKQANMSYEKVSRMVHDRTVTMAITHPLSSDEELHRCISELSPGPHALLLLLPIGNINKQDLDSLQLIKNRLGEKMADYAMIVFTNGESLDEDYTIDNYIEECSDFFKDMLKQCNGRYQVLNKSETNRTQVAELLTKIDEMAHENSYFTKEMLEMKDIQDQLKEAQMKIQERTDEKENTETQLEQLKEKTFWLKI